MENLAEIGLTNWESQTYLALLELGSTTTGPLVKKSQVPQSKIYSVLDSLMQKGLASYIIKGKTKYFQAAEPEKILSLFKQKEKQIQNLLENLKQKQSQNKQSVELFEGIKSIKSLFLSILNNVKKGENWYGFSTGKTSENPEIEDFYEWLGTLKTNVGLKDHLLISSENKQLFEKSVTKKALPFVKKITKYPKVAFPGDVAIFRNKVIILNWEQPPTAILITSENLANQYKDFFLSL